MVLPLLLTMGCTPVIDAAEAPAIGSGDEVHLLMVGDVGSDTPEREQVLDGMAEVCKRRPCDGIVLLGDLIYPRGAESDQDPRLQQFLSPYTHLAPVYLVVGNHDYGHGRDHEAIAHLRAWAAEQPDVHLPATIYQAPLGDGLGHLAVVDTNHVFQYGNGPIVAPNGPWEDQGLWLSDLSVEGPLIVAGHHPFRSNGPHGNAGAYEGWRHIPWVSGRSVQRLFQRGLRQARVYAAGHDHNLQLLPCGDTLCAVAGSGAKTRPLVERGNALHFGVSEPGFIGIEHRSDVTWVVAYDRHGIERARVKGGEGR